MSRIENPTSSESIGLFNNVAYTRYKGLFVGSTIDGNFAVPYEITTPTNPAEGSRTFIVEPPHFSSGLVARNSYLGPGFLWKRGFSHVSVGYSNVNLRILNRNPGFPLIIKREAITEFPPFPGHPKEITDDNILRELALTLKQNPLPFLGAVHRLYGIGFSDSGDTVHRVYELFGRQLFDISFPCTASYLPPVQGTKIIVFNTEADFDVRTVPNSSFKNYRWYAVAGAPHIPDTSCTRMTFHNGLAAYPGPPPANPAPPVAGTTPIDWIPFIKALFVAGDDWVRGDKKPPASAVLKVNPRGLLAMDVARNAIGGIRHPALALKEATFIASVVRGRGWDLFGAYCNPRQLKEDGSDYETYKTSFRNATQALYAAGFLLKEDQIVLNQRAELTAPPHPEPGTYTMNYLRRLFPNPTPTTDECALTAPPSS
ncbi:MAG TPA: alpha/beta hydrolase domain-containing protein [Pyrinomonadaceae bacterium]|jgi:hypothetical protein